MTDPHTRSQGISLYVFGGIAAAIATTFLLAPPAERPPESPRTAPYRTTDREASSAAANELWPTDSGWESLAETTRDLIDDYEGMGTPSRAPLVADGDDLVANVDEGWLRIEPNAIHPATFARSGVLIRQPQLLFRNSFLNPDDTYIPQGLRESLIAHLKRNGHALEQVDRDLSRQRAARAVAHVESGLAAPVRQRALPDGRTGLSGTHGHVVALVGGRPVGIPKAVIEDPPEVASLRNSIALDVTAYAIRWFEVHGYIDRQEASRLGLEIARIVR